MSGLTHQEGFAPSESRIRFVLGMMFLVMLINSVDRTVLSILVQDVKADLGLDDRQMGWLLGPAFVICYTLASLPIATWADGGRRTKAIAIGMFFWSLFTLATAAVQGFWQLFALRVGVGIGESSSSAPGQSLIASYVPAARRARSISVIAIGAVIGLAVGMMLGGYMSEWWGWRSAFIAAGIPGLVFAGVFYWSVEEPPKPAASVPWRRVLETLYAFKSLRWIIAAQATALFASMGRNLWEPTFLRRVYEMGAGEAGLWYFLTSPLPSACGIYLGGRLADRLSRRDLRWPMWVATIGQITCVPFLVLFLLWPEDHRIAFSGISGGFPVALLWSVVASVLGAFYAAPMLATTQTLAPAAMRARAAALASAIGALIGHGLGPLVVGELNVRLEPSYGEEAIRYSLLVVVLTTLISAACWYGASRHLREDLAEQS